ncbi:hypothetical protein M422DRAFT_239022 [Sphaerobolus stellatus SS14]|nr:hypothetical protein M422DRAFT_239022 [Sphaerobolus stellatus SS14]
MEQPLGQSGQFYYGRGWNHENFIAYIRKAENFHTPPEGIIKRDKLQVDPSWYGKAGPINVSYSESSSNAEPIIRILLVDDPINGKYSGTWTCATTTNPNTLARSSAFKGYVLPHLDRPNLSILVKSYVIKILIDSVKSDSVTATGVEFTHGDATYTAKHTWSQWSPRPSKCFLRTPLFTLPLSPRSKVPLNSKI